MKKRILALMLSFSMCSAMVVEAGAATVTADTAAASYTEELFTDSASETDPAEGGVTAEPEADTEESEDISIDVTEGDTTGESGDVTADGTGEAEGSYEVAPGDEGTSDGQVFTGEPEEAAPEITFEDGENASAGMSGQTPEEVQNAEAAEAESEGRLLYTRWHYDAQKGGWKLEKYQKPAESAQDAADADVTADTTAQNDDESIDDAYTMDPAQEAEGMVPSETPAPETTPEAGVPETQAPAGTETVQPEYYTDKDGLVTVTIVDEKGNELVKDATYAFDKDGYMITGKTEINGAGYYFLEAENAKTDETENTALAAVGFRAAAADSNEVPSMTPFNSDLGRMQKNTGLQWDAKKKIFYQYDENGQAVKLEGIYPYNGEYYYIQADGRPFVGEKYTSYQNRKGLYLFEKAADITGRMARNKWASVTTSKGYLWRFFQSDGRYKKLGSGAYKVYKNVYYLLDGNGYLVREKMMKASNGYYYLADKNARVYCNKMVKYGNYRYYFTGAGKRATWKNRWMRCPGIGNKYYYFGSTPGRVEEKTGMQKVTENGKYIGWFRFTGNGNHYVNTMLSGRYYLPDGRMASGFRKVGNKYYFFERSSTTVCRGLMYKRTWVKYNDKYYYARPDGTLIENGWRTIGGENYFFKNCTALTNIVIKKGNVYGVLDYRGRFMDAGWVVTNSANNRVRYLNPKTGKYYVNTRAKINGLYYYFDKSGYRRNDVTSIVKGPYSVKVDRVNGVMTVYNKSGNTPVKSIRVSVGKAGTATPKGTYTLRRSARWQLLMGPSWGQYGTHVRGAGQGGIFIHSVSGTYANSYSLPAGEYNKLGNPASHGCIRCCVADAKWIYDNCNGAKITIFDGRRVSEEALKGPLGRNKLVPLRGSMNFDPTDPAI